MANGSDIDLHLPKYLKGMRFVFNDGITAKDVNEWLPMRLINIIGATNYSYVFGGMGWWNDDPRGKAEIREMAKWLKDIPSKETLFTS